MSTLSRQLQLGKVSSELPKMEGIHGTAHHVRAWPPFVLISSGRVAGMLPRPLVAGSAHVSTLPRTCTVGLCPSILPAHEHSSTSKRHRQHRISAALGHRAVQYSHGTQPDAKVTARSKLWAANNHLCSRDKIRGGTRELEVPQAPEARPRHGLALKGSCSGRMKVARVQDDMSRPRTSSWHSPLRSSPDASASAETKVG